MHIFLCHRRSCLQFHMSSPCAILFHALAVFIKWDIILNKWFKHFAILLLVAAPMSDYLQVGYPIKKGTSLFQFFFWMGGQLVNYATSSQFHGKKQYKKCYLLHITINKVVKIEIKGYFTLAGRTSTCLRLCSILLLKTQNNFKSIVKQNHKNSVIVTIASYLK